MKTIWKQCIRGYLAALVLTISPALAVSAGLQAEITTSSTAVGVTPKYMGYDCGYYLSGSNTKAWVEYSNVNAFRIWSPSHEFDPGSRDVVDLKSFNARKAALRADLLKRKSAELSEFEQRFKDSPTQHNKISIDTALADLKTLHVAPIVELTRTHGKKLNTWAAKWQLWQNMYATVYYMAKSHDVCQFQTCNEPDQHTSPTTPEDWMVVLKVGSDAVRCAIADVNRDFKKQLVADVSAPVTINGAKTIDTWGKLALQANRTDYQGHKIAYDLFNTYDSHRYGSSGAKFASDLQIYKTKIPEYNASGQMMPVTYTEFNRRNSASYSKSTDTPETPAMFTGVADDLIGAIQEDVMGMYAFKFSQTFWDNDKDPNTPPEIQKTGFYYVNHDFESGGKCDVTGSSRGAEVLRLAARALKDARPRLDAKVATNNPKFGVVTCFDPESENYYLYSVNRDSAAACDLTVNLNVWDVAPGAVATVEEVSVDRQGEVVKSVAVPESKQIALSQPACSVWLVTIPRGKVQEQITRSAADVGCVSAKLPALNSVTYVKFNVESLRAADVGQAIFQITGKATKPGGGKSGRTLVHVYAITNDSWSGDAIQWNNAPNLDARSGKITGMPTSAFPVGQLTFGETESESGVNLTDFLRHHPDVFDDGKLSLVLMREKRFDGDDDPESSRVELVTKEAGMMPRLTLSLRAAVANNAEKVGK